MPRPTRWLAGWLVFRMFLSPPLLSEAWAAPEPVAPADTDVGLAAASPCPSLRAGVPPAPESCARTIRAELAEGTIDLAEAVSRLELCASAAPGFREALARHAELRVELSRARVAFGARLVPAEAEELRSLARSVRLPPREIPPSAVRALRAEGISPAGFAPAVRSTVLARLRETPALRLAFREVFGPAHAYDLDRLLDGNRLSPTRALSLGESVVVPGGPAGLPFLPTAAGAPEPAARPRILGRAEYLDRVADELDALEEARLRYLESASAAHRTLASVRSFARSLARLGARDEGDIAPGVRAAGDHALLLARMASLERGLGIDPVLRELAWEGVDATLRASRACAEVAHRQRRLIFAGAGGVAGLIGAAGVVVASGATGTLGGGVVIAAAVEASIGAYLMFRTERGALSAAGEGPRDEARPELPEAEERRFRPADRQARLTEGEAGEGQGEQELPVEGDESQDWAGGEGEGEGEEDGGEEEAELAPRENRIPPVLPPSLPDAMAELPPLLDPARYAELEALSLAEVQARLDEFLALDPAGAAGPTPAPVPTLRSALVEELISEATASLALWVERRELSPGFGDFFVKAELEEVPDGRRAEVFARAAGRFSGDRSIYRASSDLEDLRRRIAARLVTHCRARATGGDLVQAACADETALTILVIAAVRSSGVPLPEGSVLGVQSAGGRFHPVLFSEGTREVHSLMTGETVAGVVAPLYHPASFYYGFLVEHGVRPEIDPERHLLIALADPGLEQPEVVCEEEERGRNVFGRVFDWLRSLVGAGVPSRRGTPCGGAPAGWPGGGTEGGSAGDAAGGDGVGSGGGASSSGGEASDAPVERRGVSVSISGPRMPSPNSGGGQSGGGGQGGGGSGGGSAAGGAAGGGGRSGGGEGTPGGGSGRDAGGSEAGGARGEGSNDGTGRAGQGGGGEGRGGSGGQGGGATGAGASGGGAAGSGELSGGDAGGEGAGSAGADGSAADLAEIARETVEMRRRQEDARPLRVRPWRLRADYGYAAPSARVLFADNDQAHSRFEPEERFITLSPSDDEEQRRMLEADSFPLFPAEATCADDGLPPRRVLRREAAVEAGFRYLFCDQDESTVIFRARDDARTYAGLGAPDRPLFLVRLASERLQRLEASEEVAKLLVFLEDPDAIRGFAPEEVDSMVDAAGALLVFQQTLESALVQSMEELEGEGIRPHYYELHRQVLQGALFVRLSTAAYRFNRRLASDPLQSLAWANVLPADARQGFFRLYYLFGSPVHWPARWEVLRERYGGAPAAAAEAREVPVVSLDFLQVVSDPTRVRVDWRAEPRSTRPSIRDRKVQEGKERTPEEKPDATEAEEKEREEETERKKGGTRGKGRVGEGESAGPEKGKQPLQIINIRITPEEGEPDRHKLPADNATHPGGTRGKKKSTEESATRQEPILWMVPTAFVDALLSAWGRERGGPEAASRVPPVLRFNERLRGLFLEEMDRDEIYDGRILGAMRDFTAGGWLRYEEARRAMGGSWVSVNAFDTGRFAAKYSRTSPIRDQDQIRTPNFFTRPGAIIPADLFDPLRLRYTRGESAIFDLEATGATGEALELSSRPLSRDDAEGAARASLLRSLELIREQARER